MDSTGGAVKFQQILDFKSTKYYPEKEKNEYMFEFNIVVGTKTLQRVINVFMLRLISVSWQKGRLCRKSFGQIGKNASSFQLTRCDGFVSYILHACFQQDGGTSVKEGLQKSISTSGHYVT